MRTDPMICIGRRQALARAGAATLALALPPARADALDADERRAVRATIEAQLKALAAGDAVRAFALASAAIRRQFGDADTFFSMVRQAYPMVIAPSATAFFEPERQDGPQVLQVVQLRDAAGRGWLVSYLLQRQADLPGQPWRINGVVVQPDSGKSST